MFREDEEDFDVGKHRFLLCCILNNLHVLSNIYASSMCAYPFCAVHYTYVSCRKKKKREKISQLWKKIIAGHILLTVDCSQTNYFSIEEG